MRVILCCGGPSSEHDVSLASARAIYATVAENFPHELSVLYIRKDMTASLTSPQNVSEIGTGDVRCAKPLHEVLSTLSPEHTLCLLAPMHGEFGEDGRLQGLLEYFSLRYTGSSGPASALCMDKFRSSLIVKEISELAIPSTTFLDLSGEIDPSTFEYPLIWKPNRLGSSVGLHLIRTAAEFAKILKTARSEGRYTEVLVQEYIDGAQEVTCGVLQKKSGEIILLPPVEILPQSDILFNYESKYSDGGAVELCPPQHIAASLQDTVSRLAGEIHSLLGCTTYSRSDFLLKENTIFYMETNTLPGMTSQSLIPKEASAIGMNLSSLVTFLIDEAR